MTYVTCRLTAKNQDQLRNHTFGNRVLATFTFLLLIISLYQKKTNLQPTCPPHLKMHQLVKYQTFFYLTEGLHCTCIFRTCVFHPSEMRCFVFAFSVLALSSTCVFSFISEMSIENYSYKLQLCVRAGHRSISIVMRLTDKFGHTVYHTQRPSLCIARCAGLFVIADSCWLY